MKRILAYISFAGLVAIGFASCKKSIDLNPTTTVNGDEFFQKIDDYDFALTGAYQRLKQNGLYGGVNGGSVFLSSVDIAADNFYSGPTNLGNLNTMFRWNYAADNTVTQSGWDDAYRVIQQANVTLRGIDRFRSSDPLKVARIEGQARALRAYMHFEIFRWWAVDYDRASTNLGIAYVDNFDVEQKPARLMVKGSYDKMEADFKAAKSLLSKTDKAIESTTAVAGTSRPYIDSLVVDAMLARMYLYAKQWDSAVKYSTYVIRARRLSTPAEFPAIWQDASTAEVIWSIDYQAGNPALIREIYRPAGNKPTQDEVSWRPVTALLNLYTAGDVRTATYFTSRNGYNVPNKYFAKATAAGNPDGVVNFKIFRTAEMYLIRAEALAMKVQDISALADLNALRAARGLTAGAETGTALMDAIQTERRRELVMEGHRFFDLKRTVRTVSRTQNCSNYCTLASNNRAWALPVPQTEIIANPNMQQNPGY
jgi:hypothetical protein